MILVDTSVWIQHLRHGNETLKSLLYDGKVSCHPFISGELACGSIKNRHEVLALLDSLPVSPFAEHGEVLEFIETRLLYRRGIGWVDAHLLASALLSSSQLWTNDLPLKKVALAVHIAYL